MTAERRLPAVLALVILAFGGAVGFAIYEVSKIERTEQVVAGIERAGPCRVAGVNDPECKRQAKLIFRSCIQNDLHPACTLAKLALRNGSIERRSEGGGGDQTGSSPSEQPGPPQGGSEGNGAEVPDHPGFGTAPEQPDSPLDPLLEPVCDLLDPLPFGAICGVAL